MIVRFPIPAYMAPPAAAVLHARRLLVSILLQGVYFCYLSEPIRVSTHSIHDWAPHAEPYARQRDLLAVARRPPSPRLAVASDRVCHRATHHGYSLHHPSRRIRASSRHRHEHGPTPALRYHHIRRPVHAVAVTRAVESGQEQGKRSQNNGKVYDEGDGLGLPDDVDYITIEPPQE